MKLQEALEYLSKNGGKIVISGALSLMFDNKIQRYLQSLYDKDSDQFTDWFEFDLQPSHLNGDFKIYERKFILSEKKKMYNKRMVYASQDVKDCYEEIIRKIAEQVKPQYANGAVFINKQDTMRIIKETFGEL